MLLIEIKTSAPCSLGCNSEYLDKIDTYRFCFEGSTRPKSNFEHHNIFIIWYMIFVNISPLLLVSSMQTVKILKNTICECECKLSKCQQMSAFLALLTESAGFFVLRSDIVV